MHYQDEADAFAGWCARPQLQSQESWRQEVQRVSASHWELVLSAHHSHIRVSSSIARNFTADKQCFQKDGCVGRLPKQPCSSASSVSAVPGAQIKAARSLYSSLAPTGSQEMTDCRKISTSAL